MASLHSSHAAQKASTATPATANTIADPIRRAEAPDVLVVEDELAAEDVPLEEALEEALLEL